MVSTGGRGEPLPTRPAELGDAPVAAWQEPWVLDSYLPHVPDPFPAYLDQRVYQGSTGRIYPLPLIDRIEETARPHPWQAVHLENAWVRLTILPELGGRILIGRDRSNGYDFFYRNPVIKPALIGLTGPWIAGGVEFNWPQHHRPATSLPIDTVIEHEDDGAITVWCSDHDPFARMKGMHGIRLRPDSAVIEARVRLYNRDDEPQTFLWWANVAARAHEDYQSFFPPDVTAVADHAKRAVTGFPAADRPYYDIDYPARHDQVSTGATGIEVAGDRLDWYRNIPVPTSYMVLDTAGEFFGGYDHRERAGFVHVADRQIAVGKKQWTWGQAPFGRAWDRNLADDDAAYVELMAGVFTDNQPDFAFLAPGETKVFSQYWYPIREIGPVQQATREAAISFQLGEQGRGPDRQLTVGVASPRPRVGCTVELHVDDATLAVRSVDLAPDRPLQWSLPVPATVAHRITVVVSDGTEQLAVLRPSEERGPRTQVDASSEPARPGEIATVEELYLTGLHLAQYRHATVSPEPYWQEALRRDANHSASCTALAMRRHRAARYADAEELLRTAIDRLTRHNGNPADTSGHYWLGLTLARQGRDDEAYDAFGTALWTRQWRAPAGHQLAVLDARAGRDGRALERLDDVLRCEPEHLQARALRVVVLRRLGLSADADQELAEQRALDPLHWWSEDLAGRDLTCDPQTMLDVALEYGRVGEWAAALRVLEVAVTAQTPAGAPSALPLLHYHRWRALTALGRPDDADAALAAAQVCDDRYCFPVRLDDVAVLETVLSDHPDPRAAALLGLWTYHQGRHRDAIELWESAVAGNPDDAVSWRNLGLARHQVGGLGADAAAAYDRAVGADPEQARLWFERDQLAAHAGAALAVRIRDLESRPDLVASRDDLTIALAGMYVSVGRVDDAITLFDGRGFQPWEGGEGPALRAWERSQLARARMLAAADPAGALAAVEAATHPPRGLGEQRHPLANPALLHLCRGDLLRQLGRTDEARDAWQQATLRVDDFVDMAVQPISAVSFACVLAHRRLGDLSAAGQVITALERHCAALEETTEVGDFFATSRPVTMVFPPDPVRQRHQLAALVRAQLAACRGDLQQAAEAAVALVDDDPDHTGAQDLGQWLHHPGFFPGGTRSAERPRQEMST